MSFEISDKPGPCFVCGTPTNIMAGKDDYFCNSNACRIELERVARELFK